MDSITNGGAYKMNKLSFIVSAYLLLTIACETSFEPIEVCECKPEKNRINIIFRYGIKARNVLNTFDCTFTKDMVLDSAITTCLELTIKEIDAIYSKMNQVNFFNYPNEFHVKPTSDIIGRVTPYSTYYFYVESNRIIKELYWEDEIINPDQDADNLRELIRLIIGIIESKNEYKNLPPAEGGYP